MDGWPEPFQRFAWRLWAGDRITVPVIIVPIIIVPIIIMPVTMVDSPAMHFDAG